MKKLIFLRDGYKSYLNVASIDNIYFVDIDKFIREYGYKTAVDFVEKHFDGEYLITVCPTILHSIDWWNEEEQKFEIYIPTKKGKLKNIQEFTDKVIRRAHNIERLFLGGVFDD